MKVINITIIALCAIAIIICFYNLVTADCSYFNYVYLAGIAIAAMVGGEKLIKIL